ncbi:protein NLP7-like isoform X2 [Rhododendron vialii]|uniref:protein NLP7-like isoform X2 n=1 Tax=Rhododendron vialii TaxID=182163 RepID=UPI00265DFABC|nr:protein NLP7-like isoform X2 [Rhododendron vialii]
MPIDGSVHDAHTILLGVEEVDHFPPDFKEYIRKEQLNWSRFEADLPDLYGRPTFGWVFWSQRDHQTQLDNFADLIRNALQKLISKDELGWHLVQFWAPTKTSEGRTLLTTQFQPFALGTTSYASDARNRLCEYRMGICREYNNSFYADAECAEELLGLPGRVFLHQFPESTPDVMYYSLKEYPQRDLALRCKIGSSWAGPVFDHSSHACVGVLEIVSPCFMFPVLRHKSFLGQMYDIFQDDDDEPPLPELATTIVDDVEQKQREELRKMRDRELEEAIAKFRRTLKAVGPNLPDGGVKMRAGIKRYQDEIDRRRLRRLEKIQAKGGGVMLQLPQLDQASASAIHSGTNVVSRDQNYILPSLEALQNGEVTMQLDSCDQLSMDPSKNAQNVVIAERNIIVVTSSEGGPREMQERQHKNTGVQIEVSLDDILKYSKKSRIDAAKKLQVSVSTLKRVCRGYGIDRWPPRNIEKFRSFQPSPIENEGQTRQRLNSDLPLNQASNSVAHTNPAFQDADIVTIKAKYENNTIKFRLSLPSRLVALQQEVANRLNLEAGTYYVRYKDDENDLILIACDQDLQDCIHTFKSLGNTSVVVQLELK